MAQITYLNQFLVDVVETSTSDQKLCDTAPTTNDVALNYMFQEQGYCVAKSHFRDMTFVQYVDMNVVEFQGWGMGQYLTKVLPFMQGKWDSSDLHIQDAESKLKVVEMINCLALNKESCVILRMVDQLQSDFSQHFVSLAIRAGRKVFNRLVATLKARYAEVPTMDFEDSLIKVPNLRNQTVFTSMFKSFCVEFSLRTDLPKICLDNGLNLVAKCIADFMALTYKRVNGTNIRQLKALISYTGYTRELLQTKVGMAVPSENELVHAKILLMTFQQLLVNPHQAVILETQLTNVKVNTYMDLKVLVRVWPRLHELLSKQVTLGHVMIPVDPHTTELPTIPLLEYFLEDFQLFFMHPKMGNFGNLDPKDKGIMFAQVLQTMFTHNPQTVQYPDSGIRIPPYDLDHSANQHQVDIHKLVLEEFKFVSDDQESGCLRANIDSNIENGSIKQQGTINSEKLRRFYMCHLRMCQIITRGEHEDEIVQCYQNGVMTTKQELRTAIESYCQVLINLDQGQIIRGLEERLVKTQVDKEKEPFNSAPFTKVVLHGDEDESKDQTEKSDAQFKKPQQNQNQKQKKAVSQNLKEDQVQGQNQTAQDQISKEKDSKPRFRQKNQKVQEGLKRKVQNLPEKYYRPLLEQVKSEFAKTGKDTLGPEFKDHFKTVLRKYKVDNPGLLVEEEVITRPRFTSANTFRFKNRSRSKSQKGTGIPNFVLKRYKEEYQKLKDEGKATDVTEQQFIDRKNAQFQMTNQRKKKDQNGQANQASQADKADQFKNNN